MQDVANSDTLPQVSGCKENSNTLPQVSGCNSTHYTVQYSLWWQYLYWGLLDRDNVHDLVTKQASVIVAQQVEHTDFDLMTGVL